MKSTKVDRADYRDAWVFRRVSPIMWGLRVLASLTLITAACSKAPDKLNIVLVVLDTVRSDFTGQGGSQGDLTPQLDRLAAEGTVFSNAWATSPWTLPSHASLFTGMLSSAHGCHINSWRFSEDNQTLAELLGEAGYETGAFFSNPWLSDRLTGVLHGFETRVESPLGGPHGMSAGRGDQGGLSINGDVSEWFDRRDNDKPFFLFVNYLEAHLPYDPPLAYRERHLPDLSPDDLVSIGWAGEFNAGLHPPESVAWERVRRLYGGDVRTADGLLADLISMLKKLGLYDKAVVIVTSDHGENLGDHGLMEHQFSIHETLLAVPLVVRAPGALDRGVREEPVMLTDLFSTIIEIAGVGGVELPLHSRPIQRGPGGADPASGTPEEAPRLLFAEYGGGHTSLVANLRKLNPNIDTERFKRAYKTVRRGEFRLTVASDGALWLHNLNVDPAQESNIAGEFPTIVEELRAALVRNQSRGFVTKPEDAAKETKIDEESAKKLRSLGYIQ